MPVEYPGALGFMDLGKSGLEVWLLASEWSMRL